MASHRPTYTVLSRADSGRWKCIGRAETLAACLELITGSGDFWIRENRTDEPEPQQDEHADED